MRRRVMAVMKKEWIHIIRDARSLGVAVILPIVMLVLYGYGINLDLKNLATAVLDTDNTSVSRELLDAFKMSGYFDFKERLGSYKDIDSALDSGRVKLVLVVPRGFERDLRRGAAQIQVLTDGSDASAASLATSYSTQIALAYARNIRVRELKRQGLGNASLPTLDPRIRYWYNPELNSTNYIVPGLIAVILMLLSSLLTSMTIVRERERGTIEQIMVSPIRPMELMIGKIAPYVLLSFLDIVLVIVGSKFIFGVPLLGSVALLLVLSGAFLLAALGLGLLISSVAGNQLVAMTIAVTATMLPAILLSGFVYPISAMPAPIQVVTHLIPARYYLVIIRGIFLKGVGIETLWPQALVLLIMGAALIAFSARKFRKTM